MVLHFLILLLELGWRECAILKPSICQKLFFILLYKYQNDEDIPPKSNLLSQHLMLMMVVEFSTVVTEAFNGNPAHPVVLFISVFTLQTSYLFPKAMSD